MSTVARFLWAVDGLLCNPTDKTSLMHAIEDATVKPLDAPPVSNIVQRDPAVKVLITDVMGVPQSITKNSHLQDAFSKQIGTIMAKYDEGHIVFDRYLDQSFKNKAWLK